MTFKIQKSSLSGLTVFKLSGRMESEHLSELEKMISSETLPVVLDLEEVKIVDRDSIEFLERCETDGIELKNCPEYIRQWIAVERDKSEDSQQKIIESKRK